ncbi:MAG: cyclase family protein [Clostridia bacterium]|nr:cyclase family protein [Clostridia bacterium]
MKIYDITQELFSSHVYPGDKKPEYRRIADTEKGDICSITEISINAHNGTHIDAPRHFVRGADTIEQLSPEIFLGDCVVTAANGPIGRDDIIKCKGEKRILFKGDCYLTVEGADALAEIGAVLFGIETQSITGSNPPAAVHVALLSKGVCALEGLVLSDVPEGKYFLSALPIKLGGSEGAPCRAVLVEKCC